MAGIDVAAQGNFQIQASPGISYAPSFFSNADRSFMKGLPAFSWQWGVGYNYRINKHNIRASFNGGTTAYRMKVDIPQEEMPAGMSAFKEKSGDYFFKYLSLLLHYERVFQQSEHEFFYTGFSAGSRYYYNASGSVSSSARVDSTDVLLYSYKTATAVSFVPDFAMTLTKEWKYSNGHGFRLGADIHFVPSYVLKGTYSVLSGRTNMQAGRFIVDGSYAGIQAAFLFRNREEFRNHKTAYERPHVNELKDYVSAWFIKSAVSFVPGAVKISPKGNFSPEMKSTFPLSFGAGRRIKIHNHAGILAEVSTGYEIMKSALVISSIILNGKPYYLDTRNRLANGYAQATLAAEVNIDKDQALRILPHAGMGLRYRSAGLTGTGSGIYADSTTYYIFNMYMNSMNNQITPVAVAGVKLETKGDRVRWLIGAECSAVFRQLIGHYVIDVPGYPLSYGGIRSSKYAFTLSAACLFNFRKKNIS
ncbi:MAG: hypothetical protein Fur0041_19940 [Bacteroidia bacterium]